MNNYPSGGQYNYNPAAYAQASVQAQQRQYKSASTTHQHQQSAQPQPQRQNQPQQRQPTTATNRNAAAVITNATKVPPVGRYASSSLSILGSMNELKSKKRSVHDLDRLVHPLMVMVCTANSNNNDDDEEDSNEDIVSDKKRKENKNNEQKHAAAVHHFYRYKKSTSEKKDGITPTTKYEYQEQLQTELEHYKQQNKQLMERRSNVFKSLVSLHDMYETGLDGIARMNDLRFCPDNVMPDDIPKCNNVN